MCLDRMPAALIQALGVPVFYWQNTTSPLQLRERPAALSDRSTNVALNCSLQLDSAADTCDCPNGRFPPGGR